ncbi:MAG TPA: pilin [Candidatus Saccharimonadales bacterium]|nr:pilin [Candidatus Saccharimonadales bacterium]
MFKRFLVVLGILSGLLFGAFAPATVAAYNPFQNAGCDRAGQSAVCQTRGSTEDPVAGPNGVLIRATNIVAYAAGTAAVIFLVFGGIKYMTSTGTPAEVQKAKDTVMYALIGIVAIVLARSIIGFVINRI